VESLESKLDRLSPDQRKVVEDFVDFLLSRSAAPGSAHLVPSQVPVIPPVLAPTQPVLMAQDLQPPTREPTPPIQPADTPEPAEPVITEITAGGDDWVTRDYMDYGKFEEQSSPATEAVKKVKRKLIEKGQEEKPRRILDWID